MSQAAVQNGPHPRRVFLALSIVLVGLFLACRIDMLFKSGPSLSLSVIPPVVQDSAVAGSAAPLNRDVLVQPHGSDSVTWKASVVAGSPWLTMKTTGATGAGTLSLSLTSSSLPAGTYVDTVLISPQGFEDQAVKIPVEFTVRAPSFQLVFTVQPASGRAGSAISPAVQVTARDVYGHTVTSFTGNVTMSLGVNPTGATLSGTTTVAATSGVARFSNLV